MEKIKRVVNFLFSVRGRVSRKQYFVFFLLPFLVSIFSAGPIDSLRCSVHPTTKLRAALVDAMPEEIKVLDGQKVQTIKETCMGARMLDISLGNRLSFKFNMNLGGNLSTLIQVFVFLFWIWPFHAVSIKRAHDFDVPSGFLIFPIVFACVIVSLGFFMSGLLLILLGFFGLCAFIILIMLSCIFIKGSPNSNKFGPPPISDLTLKT